MQLQTAIFCPWQFKVQTKFSLFHIRLAMRFHLDFDRQLPHDTPIALKFQKFSSTIYAFQLCFLDVYKSHSWSYAFMS